jgi:hypothetical protein
MDNVLILTTVALATLMVDHAMEGPGLPVRCSGMSVVPHALLSKSKIKTKETKISVSISTPDAQVTLMEGHVTIEYGPLVRCSGKNVVHPALLFKTLTGRV